MHVPTSQRSRAQRRSHTGRTQRLHSFSRSWRRQIPAALMMSLLPLGLTRSTQAAPTAAYGGSDGNYSTSGNFKDSGNNTVVPDGSNGTFYAVSITGAAVTHDHSTGTGGVDTIDSLTTNGNFYLSGGILAGHGASRSSLFTLTGSPLFQLGGGATLRNFTVTGGPITMNGSGTLDNVTTGLAGTVLGTLTFANNTLATVSGNNTFNLGSYNDGSQTLTGAGTLALGDAGGAGTLAIGQYDAATIAAGTIVSGGGLGGTIQFGNGGSSLTNKGTLQANGGALTIQSGNSGFASSGTLQALNGGTLNLNVNLTNTGTVTAAAGSTVALNGVTLTGGTLSTTGTGVVSLNQSALTGVTSSANISVIGGRSNVLGTFTNTGTLTVGAGNSFGLGSYNDGPITLAGAGTVVLTGGTLAIGQYDAATIAAGQTVSASSGASTLNFDNGNSVLTNNGIIQSSGGTLTVQGANSGFTNAAGGLVESVNGGLFNLNVNLVGNLFVDGASTFNLNGVNVSSGTLSGAGTFTLFNSSLSNDTVSSGLNITAQDSSSNPIASSTAYGVNTLTGGSVITVGGGNTLSLGSYNDGVTETLTGTGSVILGDAHGTGTLNVGQYDAAAIGPNVTVTTGGGRTGVINGANGNSTLTNGGTITATGAGGMLTIQNLNAGFTNNATLQAIGGGTVNLNTSLTNLGTLTAATGSTLDLNNMTLTGTDGTTTGLLSTTGTGAVNVNQSALVNVTTAAGSSLNVINGRSNAFGTLTNNGVVTVATGNTLGLGSYNEGSITLAGAGSVALTGGTFAIGQYDAGVIAAGQTVRGVGSISGDNGSSSLTNGGTIQASGGTLTVQNLGGGLANNATLQALNGGTLNLNSNVTNAGTISAATGSTVALNGITLTGATGGLLTSAGTGVVNVNQSALTNVTSSANASVVGGRSNVLGTFTNNGVVTVGSGNTLGLGSYNEGTHTLAGSGAVVLSGTGTLTVGQYDAGVIAAGQTVRGVGSISGDNGSSSLTNGGTIQASGGTLTVQNLGGGLASREGNFAAVNAGTLNVNVGLTSGSTGTVTTAAGSTVNLNNALTQDQGTSQVDGIVNMGSGNTLTVTGGTLKGSGTVNGTVAVLGSGTVAPGDSPGTLTVGGDYTQTGGVLQIEYTASATNPAAIANDKLIITGTATTGGRLDVSFLGPSVNGQYLATAGEPGTSFDFLTFGTLGNTGGLGGLFTNEFAVGGNYFVNGIASNSVAGALPIYQLTQNGSALHLTLTTAAAPEPSQIVSLGGGLLAIGFLAMRRAWRKRQEA